MGIYFNLFREIEEVGEVFILVFYFLFVFCRVEVLEFLGRVEARFGGSYI